MAKHYYDERPWYEKLFKALVITVLTLIAIGGIFCFVVLIYGGCTNQTFIEVLKAWFAIKPAQPADTETVVEPAKIFISWLMW